MELNRRAKLALGAGAGIGAILLGAGVVLALDGDDGGSKVQVESVVDQADTSVSSTSSSTTSTVVTTVTTEAPATTAAPPATAAPTTVYVAPTTTAAPAPVTRDTIAPGTCVTALVPGACSEG